MKKIFKLMIVSSLSILLLTSCNNVHINNGKVYTEEDMTHFYSEKVAIDELQALDITSNYANLEIIASDDFYMEYSYYYINNEPILSIEDHKLTFSDQKINTGSYSIHTKHENYLKIYIPTLSEFETIQIDKSSGSCSIGSVKVKEMDISNQYGETILSGSVIDQLDLEESSGEILIENTSIRLAKIVNTYGEVVLNTINSQEEPGESLKLTLSSGKLSLDQVFSKESSIKNTYGEVEIKDSGLEKLDTKLSSGNLMIDRTEVETLSVENTYGLVKLNLLGKEEDYRFDIESEYGNVEIGDSHYKNSVLIDRGAQKEVSMVTSSGNIQIKFKE